VATLRWVWLSGHVVLAMSMRGPTSEWGGRACHARARAARTPSLVSRFRVFVNVHGCHRLAASAAGSAGALDLR
jgi:hypothetical protein